MSARQIQCTFDQNNILTPGGIAGQPNITYAELQCQNTPDGLTGTLSWAGVVKAFLTFDMTGRRVLSITLTDYDPSTATSVNNIVSVL